MVQAAIYATAILVVWAVAYYVQKIILRRRFVSVAPGRVYQSGAMSPRLLIRYVRRYSIDTVIDFRGAGEEGTRAERQALEGTGVRYINIPVGTLPTREDLRHFLDVMSQELVAGSRVLMHCKDGQGRAI